MCVNGWELPAEHVSRISGPRTINLRVLRIQVQAAGMVWGLGTSCRIDWASEASFWSDPYCAYLYPASRLQPWSAWKEEQYGAPLLHMHIWVLSVIMQVPVKTLFPLCADVCGQFCLFCACVCLCVCVFHMPCYLETWKCSSLVTIRSGRRNLPMVCSYLMKLPLTAPPGHLEPLGLPKDVYRAFQIAANAHIDSGAWQWI